MPVSASASTLAQPIPVDTNGDMKIDLLGVRHHRVSMQEILYTVAGVEL